MTESFSASDAVDASLPGKVYDHEKVGMLISDIVDAANGLDANLLELREACRCVASASGEQIRINSERIGD